MHKIFLKAVSIFVFFFVPSLADAFGYDAHKIIGEISRTYLTPSALRQIDSLMAGDKDTTFAQFSIWPDLLRSDSTYAYASSWHYVNIPAGTVGYDRARDCQDGNCLPEVILQLSAQLKDSRLSQRKKQDALKFLLHFIQDAHQPLHAGRLDDLGGNTIPVNYFGAVWNLHQVWDFQMLKNENIPWELKAKQLRQEITTENQQEWYSIDPVVWINESSRYAYSHAYVIGSEPTPQLGQAYQDRNLPLLELRMKQAAIRAAAVLNDIFKP